MEETNIVNMGGKGNVNSGHEKQRKHGRGRKREKQRKKFERNEFKSIKLFDIGNDPRIKYELTHSSQLCTISTSGGSSHTWIQRVCNMYHTQILYKKKWKIRNNKGQL